ncbi:MAG: NADH-quinone oxidoreductase subunit NuoK [Anaerolineaceae bacterium]|nr:NADH-quinone oxidoreductase subunit NuoK [Anaerolineaceae bacterium]
MPLSWFLVLSAALFSIGLFGVLARKNVIAVLMSIELMLNAVNISIIAFWRYLYAPDMSGLVFVAIVFVAAAAEAAVGLALVVSEYRRRQTVLVEEMDLLKG